MQRSSGSVAHGNKVVRVDRRIPNLGRVAMLSVHTSPLEQPGSGDAGGMNVYVIELSRRLAALGIKVEIFTRATSRSQPSVIEMSPGILVRHVIAGPFEGLTKSDLPGQLCTFAREVLRTEAAYEPGYYDLIHSHYWLSGQVGALARDRWGVPLVHSMHTMAKVKNELLATGDEAEPAARVIGEQQVVDAADLIIANTSAEGQQLVDLYDARPDRLRIINPGVDLTVFSPGDKGTARDRVGLDRDALVVMFAGRLQPLKAPDVVVRAAAAIVARRPDLRSRLVVPIIGGPSGSGHGHTSRSLRTCLAARLGVSDVVRFVPPVGQADLVDHYRAASIVCVPSYNESFGLVALEAQACGTPVVAANGRGASHGRARRRHRVAGRGASGRRLCDRDRAAAGRPAAAHRSAGRRGRARAGPSAGRGRLSGPWRPIWTPSRSPSARPWPRRSDGGPMTGSAGEAAASTIRAALAEAQIEAQEPTHGTFVFDLPGERKLSTPCRLIVGDHAVAVHAFVCRNPDENHEGVYRWLLSRNLRLYGVSFAIDHNGDIYLDGRLSLASVTPAEVDRLLGAVLSYADESFNTILELGFATSIRKEWEWRVKRGESTHNLDAFRGWLEAPPH